MVSLARVVCALCIAQTKMTTIKCLGIADRFIDTQRERKKRQQLAHGHQFTASIL